jgi:hypothetical protein
MTAPTREDASDEVPQSPDEIGTLRYRLSSAATYPTEDATASRWNGGAII